jgi:hypothetical protein
MSRKCSLGGTLQKALGKWAFQRVLRHNVLLNKRSASFPNGNLNLQIAFEIIGLSGFVYLTNQDFIPNMSAWL